jgi:ATP-dependent Clp protease ATP-binding subunit ClpC
MRLHHDHIGTEHLLLGIVKEGSGLAAIVLDQFQVSLGTVRQKVEHLVHGPSSGSIPAKLPQTERYARALSAAVEEARALSHNYIGTEHILLGLLREPDGTAARVLAEMNLKLDDVRAAVLKLLGRGSRLPETDAMLERAIKDLTTRLADELIAPEKIKIIAEAILAAGWRPQV